MSDVSRAPVAGGPAGGSAHGGVLPPPNGEGPFDPPGVLWTPVSPRLATARRVATAARSAVLAVIVVVVCLVLDLTSVMAGLLAALVLLTGWELWIIGRQVRAWGYAEREEDLLVRHGILWRELVVVPYGRMQYVDVEAGPLDRAFRIARVQLHTASASTDAKIPGLPPEEAARLRDRLASRGQSQLAGL